MTLQNILQKTVAGKFKNSMPKNPEINPHISKIIDPSSCFSTDKS